MWRVLLASIAIYGAVMPSYAQQAPANAPSAADRLNTQREGTVDKAQLEKRLESVGTLIEKSSGARQVETSGDKRAAEKRAEAKSAYAEAQEAYKAGDYPRASRLLSQASGTMFEAVRLASPEQVTGEKQRADFNSRLESVKALLAAQKRISSEKAGVRDSAQTTREIEKLMQEAEQQAATNKYDQANTTLNRAYLIAKAAIGSMRGGDTLVRSLNFANKEEEYKYELDRNDTHHLLIKVLLDDKRGSESMIQGFMQKAHQLRGEAESSAKRGDHAGAVKLLEDSTAELVKAIRNAGVFIPG